MRIDAATSGCEPAIIDPPLGLLMLHDPHQPQPARTSDLVAILRQATVFGDLTSEQLGRLAHRARLVRRDAGESLFQHGDRARALYLLLAGQALRAP